MISKLFSLSYFLICFSRILTGHLSETDIRNGQSSFWKWYGAAWTSLHACSAFL
ncbi:hypothetical protein M758_UG203400 [Ceratodon purpureus]|nr:hypothetical protein M758_UG203400 [Ceratodon purpureus]